MARTCRDEIDARMLWETARHWRALAAVAPAAADQPHHPGEVDPRKIEQTLPRP
ncbi:MAG: hypothetical protein ACOY4R_26280 [Pseudomonadota bacterium]